MSMMHNTSPRAAASLGQWMKNIATALFVAIFTDRALLVQHRGGISFTEHFAAPCFDWEYEAVVPRMYSVPTANNTYRLTSHVLRAKQPTALPWHEHYKLLQSGDLAGETAAYPFLQVDIAKFVLPLLAQNPRYSVEIHNLFGVNAVSHVYRLLFRPKPQGWLEREINAYRSLHFRHRTVGSHIRVGHPSIHVTADSVDSFLQCVLRKCRSAGLGQGAMFLSTSNRPFILHHLNTSQQLSSGCPILTYDRPVTIGASRRVEREGLALMALIEMLILSRTDEMVAFMGSSFSQAAFLIAGMIPTNEHCVSEPHLAPADVCAHYEDTVLWRSERSAVNRSIMQATTTFKSWPIPQRLDLALHGAAKLEGCDGVLGKERGPECCRIPDGILDFSKISFPLDLDKGMLAIVFNFTSHIPDTVSDFIARYRGSVLTERDAAYLASAPIRAKIHGRIAGTRIVRRLQVQARSPEKVASAAVVEGFIGLQAFADATCDTLLHDFFVSVGPCETNQFLWGRKYGGSFRVLYSHSEAQGEQIVVAHFPHGDDKCGEVDRVRTQVLAFGACNRLRDGLYMKALEFVVRPPVTLIQLQKDGQGKRKQLGMTLYANGKTNRYWVSQGSSGNTKGSLLTKLPHLIKLTEDQGVVHFELQYQCALLGNPTHECLTDNNIDVQLKCGSCLPVDNNDDGVSLTPEIWCFVCHKRGDPNALHLHGR